MQFNGWFVFVLVTVVLLWKLDFFSTLLNLKSLRPEIPEPFRGVYDEEKYQRSQEYTRTNSLFGIVESVVSLVAFLVFWWLGGFQWLDEIVRGWGLGPLLTGLVYVSILLLASQLLDLPLDLYDTFVIEEKFGFNKTTPGTFFLDRIKGLLLGAVIGLPLLALLLWLFDALPMAWLWGWLAVTAVSLFLAYVAPTWIMPLFNRFEPLEDGELKTAIHEMAEDCEFSLREVMVMDGSKRSTKSNAFFTGFGKNKRIALFDTLIERHTVPELVAVLAHEIGHYKKRHVLQHMAVSIVTTGVLFYLLGLVLNNRGLFDAFGVKETSVYLSLVFFGILAQPLNRLLAIGGNVWSRKHEFEADAFARKATGEPAAMVTALKKLSQDNLSNLTPHPFHVFLNYSHPPVLRRIEALEAAG